MKTLTAMILLIACGCLSGCKFETSTSVGLTVEDYTFARTDENGLLVTIDEAVYQRGEPVHLILINVSGFKKGEDGLNRFDMEMEITGPDRETMLSVTEMLGEEGHIDLQDNTAKSPYATFTSTPEIAAGEYHFKIRIYDLVGKGHATKSVPFTLK